MWMNVKFIDPFSNIICPEQITVWTLFQYAALYSYMRSAYRWSLYVEGHIDVAKLLVGIWTL